MNPVITPYLFFSGRCEEALSFYRDGIGAEIQMLMRYSESPDPVPPGMLQEGFEHKVMHASIRIGNAAIMASDGCNEQSRMEGVHLAFSVNSEAEAQRAFHALAEGGNIQMPLGKTFWSPCFGMVTDKFNVSWMVMVTEVR